MSRRETNLVVVLAVVALVGLAVGVAALIFALAETHRTHTKIHVLQRQVRALCKREIVSGVRLTGAGGIAVKTARGC
ncbi:MAG: hypothetical protein ACRDM1_15935 [Gaiellaceae bacterium]